MMDEPTVEQAALNLVRSSDETTQNYWRAWLGYLLDGWQKPPPLDVAKSNAVR